MSEKTFKKTAKPQTPKPAAKRADAAYPVDQEDLDNQKQRLRKAAAAGAGAMKSPAPAAMPGLTPTPAAVTPTPPSPPRLPTSAAVKQTSTPTALKTVNVSFAFAGLDAKRVSLCGEFNGWSPDASPMTRQESGWWETALALRPGRYQYKFVVDGQWMNDPNARENILNQHGSLNSVVVVPL